MRQFHIITLLALVACGTTGDIGRVLTESGGEETGELDEGPPCEGLGGVPVGSNNHLEYGQCHCNEGFDWCDVQVSLDCCPE